MRTIFFFIFSPAVLYFIYDIFFYYIPIINNNYTYITIEFIFFMIFCDIFVLLSFIFLFFKRNKKKVEINYAYKSISTTWYYLFNITIFILINFLIFSAFDSIDYTEVIQSYSKFYALSKRGTAWVFAIINFFLFLMILDLFKNGLNFHKLLLLILAVIQVSMTGGRSLMIVLLMFVFFNFIVIHKNKINFGLFLFVLLLSIAIFISNSILRATDFESYTNSNNLKLDFDNAFVLNDVIKYTNDKSSYLIFIEDLYYMFQPRKIFPDKPLSTAETRLIYPDVAEYGTNYTFGIYANALLNIGYFAFIAIPIFLIIMNYLYIKYILYSHKKNLKYFLLVFYLFYSIQFIRGGIFNTRLIIIGISLVLAYYVYLLIPKKSFTK